MQPAFRQQAVVARARETLITRQRDEIDMLQGYLLNALGALLECGHKKCNHERERIIAAIGWDK